jgi:hypothetical protein
MARAEVDTLAQSHPDRSAVAYNLGAIMLLHSIHLDNPDAVDTAVGMWQSAARSATARPETRFNAAVAWGAHAAARRQWPSAAEGYGQATALLPLIAWRGLGRLSREYNLSRSAGRTADAAAATIAADRADEAVALLELGRCVLWSQLLDTRTDLTRLRTHDPELANRAEALRAALAP